MSEIQSPNEAQIPLKIAVAGAGIGVSLRIDDMNINEIDFYFHQIKGMFLGYCLQKKGFDVTVFERSAKFSRFGLAT